MGEKMRPSSRKWDLSLNSKNTKAEKEYIKPINVYAFSDALQGRPFFGRTLKKGEKSELREFRKSGNE
jgi:hypothetical protein